MGSEKVEWYKTAKGKEYTRKYRKINASKHAEYKRKEREKYAKQYPDKIKCRELLGLAVRHGLIKQPEEARNWHNHYDFHHPDHSRPYYGVWVTRKDHSAIERGTLACPPCVDYSDYVKDVVLKKWGFQ